MITDANELMAYWEDLLADEVAMLEAHSLDRLGAVMFEITRINAGRAWADEIIKARTEGEE